ANVHLHIAVNRTNPDTLKVIQPHRGFDIEEAHRIVALLEHRQGWASESHPRYVINDQGEIVRRQSKPISKPRNEAANFESTTGEKSAQRIAQERGHSVIKNAASWAELHQGMAKVGLRFEKKGSGASCLSATLRSRRHPLTGISALANCVNGLETLSRETMRRKCRSLNRNP
ncbi:MAG: relaxase/mobilization nuclease domain-containing protein, partial [Desulfovibrio sp.]|nr:relaxase/mobilization nuclease domain-containing protein [Desulfovibrio sp.]